MESLKARNESARMSCSVATVVKRSFGFACAKAGVAPRAAAAAPAARTERRVMDGFMVSSRYVYGHAAFCRMMY